MTVINSEYNDVNGAGATGESSSSRRCFTDQQCGPGRHLVTAETSRRVWNKELNEIVIECYYKSKPTDEKGVPIRGYKQRMYRAWEERGMMDEAKNHGRGKGSKEISRN